MNLAHRYVRALVLVGVTLLGPRAHAADVDPACATAYAKGQDDRLAGRLFDARTSFQRCAVASCPAAVAHDCSAWVAEVEADLPTVVVQASDSSGRPLASFRAFADGVPIAPGDLLRPLVLEAGPHSLRIEADGYDSVTVQTALRPTDRELVVRATLYTPGELARLNAPPKPSKSPPTLSLVLAGVGVVALGSSAYFGLSANDQYQDLKRTCAPGCTPAQADAVKSKAVISDLALAVSLLAFGGAAWVFFGSPEAPKTALVVSSRAHGADASLSVAF